MEKRHTQKKTEGMVMGESTFRSHVPEAVQLGMGTARAVGGVVVYISFQFWAASIFFFFSVGQGALRMATPCGGRAENQYFRLVVVLCVPLGTTPVPKSRKRLDSSPRKQEATPKTTITKPHLESGWEHFREKRGGGAQTGHRWPQVCNVL